MYHVKPNVWDGSLTEVTPPFADFRFAPDNSSKSGNREPRPTNFRQAPEGEVTGGAPIRLHSANLFSKTRQTVTPVTWMSRQYLYVAV